MEDSVTAFAYKASNGSLSPLQTVSALSTLRKDYKGPKEAAEIVVHPSGNFSTLPTAPASTPSRLLHQSAKGTLQLKTNSHHGKNPRNFASIHRQVPPRRQPGVHNIVTFRIDAITGALSPTGDVVSPAPVCIVFVAIRLTRLDISVRHIQGAGTKPS